MSQQTIQSSEVFRENVSKHPAYRETKPPVWLRPKTKQFTEGDDLNGPSYLKTPDPNGAVIFDLAEYERKKDSVESNYEKMLLGWKGPFYNSRQVWLDAEIDQKETGHTPKYNEIITAETFSAVKSLPKLIVLQSIEQLQHDLLSTIRVETTNDLNGIKILDVQNVGDDLLQLQGEHTVPRDIPALDILSYTLNTKRWGFRTAFSYEIGMVRLDIQNLDQILLNTLAGKIELRRNKDVANIINAVGNSGSQANWTTISATDHFTNYAYDDIKESINLINQQYVGVKAQYVGMHPDVYTAFYRNLASTQLMGQQNRIEIPYQDIISTKTAYPAFPGITFLEDTLLTTNRFFTWNRDAIWQLYGGLRTVEFENREVGYFGTNFRTYFNTALLKSSLINGGTGVIS
jgi:hypothetical protein